MWIRIGTVLNADLHFLLNADPQTVPIEWGSAYRTYRMRIRILYRVLNADTHTSTVLNVDPHVPYLPF